MVDWNGPDSPGVPPHGHLFSAVRFLSFSRFRGLLFLPVSTGTGSSSPLTVSAQLLLPHPRLVGQQSQG